ncbi:MAG: DNA polymerase III subunit delta, partial [Muribaculaceae bacterium]|nr:DNA polymerase III subunit delta [Muribaculaceae bacterium]
MAKKSTGPSYRDLMTKIKRKDFSPVYILMGEESYYLDQLTKALENYVIDEADRDFNSLVFYGADADVATVIGSAQQYPVMAERQLVVLKEAQAMTHAKTQLDKFASYVAKPNKTTVLVIVYKGGELSSTSSLMKNAKGENCTVFRSEKLRDYELKGPIKDYCSEKGVGIDDKALALLCDYIGNPLSKLFGEIDKLIIAGGNVNRISPELIE